MMLAFYAFWDQYTMPESSKGCGLRAARPPPAPDAPRDAHSGCPSVAHSRRSPRCSSAAAHQALHRPPSPQPPCFSPLEQLTRPFIDPPHRSLVSTSRVSDGVLQHPHLSDAPLEPVLDMEVYKSSITLDLGSIDHMEDHLEEEVLFKLLWIILNPQVLFFVATN